MPGCLKQAMFKRPAGSFRDGQLCRLKSSEPQVHQDGVRLILASAHRDGKQASGWGGGQKAQHSFTSVQ